MASITMNGVGGRVARIPAVILLLVILIASFAATTPGFLSPLNLLNVSLQSSVLLLLTLPMTLVVMTEGLDISVGAVLGTCGIVLVMIYSGGYGLVPALLAALAVGLAFGTLNGLLVAQLGLPPFVVTLGAFGIAQGVALLLTGGEILVMVDPVLQVFYRGRLLGIPVPVVIAAIAYGLTHFLLYHSRFGAAVFAIGGNREALAMAGVRVVPRHIAVYAYAGLMAAVASFILTGRINAGHPTVAIGLEFDAIVAVVLGGTSLEKGDGWLLGSVFGVLVIGLVRNGLNLLDVPSPVQVLSIGLLLLAMLTLDRWRGRGQ
jgi:ribose transport system permease protein